MPDSARAKQIKNRAASSPATAPQILFIEIALPYFFVVNPRSLDVMIIVMHAGVYFKCDSKHGIDGIHQLQAFLTLQAQMPSARGIHERFDRDGEN